MKIDTDEKRVLGINKSLLPPLFEREADPVEDAGRSTEPLHRIEELS